MRIIAKEFNNPSNRLEFSWLPTEIKDNGGNVMFASYNLLDRGEFVRPSGNDLRKISWEGRFPGEARKEEPYLVSDWEAPEDCDDLLRQWASKRKKVKLTIENTNINKFTCYINNYSSTYTGGFGDIEYSIEWIAYKSLSVNVTKRSKTIKKQTKRAKKDYKTHIVKSGDTLWGIAAKYLGKGTRWKEIYKLNKSTIEKAAKAQGFKSSHNGHWIWPKTTLKLPKK
ncbi:LysM peptidoglycan-binding domain-containing protein [Emergencia timonensis]|uniref:LysM peptidoglycan-binding domain-containing protein n=1 Tax=Emergencia timonensis TaxID=1776384 RepID=UPI003991B854